MDEKPQLAIWDYTNTDEDFERRVVMNVTPLMKNPELTEDQKQQALAIMDQVVKTVLATFNVMPKSAEFENRIRSDSEGLVAEEK